MSSIPWQLIGAVALPNAVGFLSGYASNRNDSYGLWYESLKKPDWRPPKLAFPIAWSCLYSGMGYASYLMWKEGGGFLGRAKLPLIFYGVQLAVNSAWSPIFFGNRSLKGGLITIVALDALALGTAVLFHRVNPVASYIMVPYLAWLGLATALNYRIYKDNPKITEVKD